MDDLQAVMDAAGTDNAGLFGNSEGGPISMLFRGVTYPQRLHSLAVHGTSAGFIGTALDVLDKGRVKLCIGEA